MKNGFTLAEVLIVIGVIGIVAALTIPNLLAKTNEKQHVAQLLRVYSQLTQAHKLMQEEFDPITTWNLESTSVGIDPETGKSIYNHSAQSLIAERLRKYLKVAKVCEVGKVCDERARYSITGKKLSNGGRVLTNSGDSPADSKFYLIDGTLIQLGWYSADTGLLDYSVVLPDRKRILGKTEFYFVADADGVKPEGLPNTNMDFDEYCKTEGTNSLYGRGCTAWVIQKKNMDYLHCNLSWNGEQTTCK